MKRTPKYIKPMKRAPKYIRVQGQLYRKASYAEARGYLEEYYELGQSSMLKGILEDWQDRGRLDLFIDDLTTDAKSEGYLVKRDDIEDLVYDILNGAY